MNSDVMISNLTQYFVGKYPDKQFEELRRICDNIPDGDRENVWEYVRDNNKPNYRVGVNSIVEACRKLGVPYRSAVSQTAPVIDWTCECGTPFKYQMGAGGERHDDRIYDVCPRCGMDPQVMMRAQAAADRGDGRKPEWYFRVFGECYKAHCLPGKEPHIDRRIDTAWSEKEKKGRAQLLKTIIDEEAERIVKLKEQVVYDGGEKRSA